ncbi:MAG: type II and III secretion system family protein [Pseudomonadota bacterium]
MEISQMIMVRQSFKKTFVLTTLAIAAFSLGGCELTQNYLKQDRENAFEPQDYRDALAPREVEVDPRDQSSASNIPPLRPYVAQPNNNFKPMPLVSISVNRTIPLRDVLYEIAEQAEYDIELDPRISGSIIFSARNRPLDQVIERIADIAGLRYEFKDDMLRVEIDTPYHEIYKVNYLALTRTNTSSIRNDISVVSGDGADTGSTFTAANESVIDFWGELETNLESILNANRDAARLATEIDPQVTVAEANPASVDPIVMDDQGNIAEAGPNVQVQAPDAVLNVESLEVDEEQREALQESLAARFSVNRQAGLVSVFAPERIHNQIASYMEELKRSATSQVLIEAKVLEVVLNDEYAAGINWEVLFDGGANGGIGFGPQAVGGLVRGVLEADDSIASNAGASFTSGDFTAAVDALSRFGTVSALASPRLTVLNNQSAALNVAENVVYFEIEVQTTSSDAGIVTTFDTDPKTVPEGVLINVQPAIDLDARTVSMAIRPTITTITSFTNDPNPELIVGAVTIESPVPNLSVQEFDSVIKMEDGQAVVLGGLINDRSVSTTNRVPVAGELPILGSLFRNQEDGIQKTELVVFLKSTIVDTGADTIHNADKDLYRTFSSDRRPFRL